MQKTNLVNQFLLKEAKSFVSSLPALLVLSEGVEAPLGGPTMTPLAFIVSLKQKKLFFFINNCLPMPLFHLLFHSLVLRRVHFTYGNFAWGLHGGVDVKWSGGLLVLELH